MSDRIDELVGVVERLEVRISRLESELSALLDEKPPPAEPMTPPAEPTEAKGETAVLAEELLPQPKAVSNTRTAAEIGRLLLILAGAFLLRTLTDMKAFPQLVGLILGLTYSQVWIFFAHWSGTKGQKRTSMFYGIAAAAICFPLIYEMTTQFGQLSANVSALILALLLGISLFVAVRRDLPLLAWIFSLGTMGTSVALFVATGTAVWFTLLLIAIGVATMWFDYLKKWHGLRWVTAVAANGVVLKLISLVTNPDGIGEKYAVLDIQMAYGIVILLPIAYLSTLVYRTIVLKNTITAFGVIQSLLVLGIGVMGVLRIGEIYKWNQIPLGVVLILFAAGAYVNASVIFRREVLNRRNFLYYSAIGLLLTFVATPILVSGVALWGIWMALAIVGSYLAARFGRNAFRVQSMIFVIAAGIQSGLTLEALRSFVGTLPEETKLLNLSSIGLVAAVCVCYILMIQVRKNNKSGASIAERYFFRARTIQLVVALNLLLFIGGLAVILLARAGVAMNIQAEPSAFTAVLRTFVISASVLVCAALGRKSAPLRSLSWLVYPVLLFGGVKLVAEDLRACPPGYLVFSFVCFGVTLIIATRIYHKTVTAAKAEAK